jgi:hypothetical protein
MADHNELFAEACSVLGYIVPAHATAATYTSGWVDVSLFQKFGAIITVGTLGASATLTAKLEQATSSGGAGVKDITGKAISGLTQTPTDNSTSQQIINCRSDELDVANGFRYVRINVVVGTATSDFGALLMGLDCKYGPATDHDNATVTQSVN